MGNGPYTHKQAKFGDDVDNLDLDLDDLGSGELSKNFAPPKDPMQKNTIDEKMGRPGGANETLGLGNDTIGHYDRIAIGPGGTAGNRLDQTTCLLLLLIGENAWQRRQLGSMTLVTC